MGWRFWNKTVPKLQLTIGLAAFWGLELQIINSENLQKMKKEQMKVADCPAQIDGKPIVSCWHFLPEMPEIKKEVLVAIKYDDIPVQAYWDGKDWNGSFVVRDNMRDGYVNDESFINVCEWIYAWCELPSMPEPPLPF